MFDKVLIANRGEIACRIIATCRRLGVGSVAVYSDADAHAQHVQLADEARHLGAAPAAESYLNIERVLQAARDSGAQAVHPGYGFLSENPRFAERVGEAGLVFIGPSVSAMQAMSSKATARELMLRAGVPVLPGYQGERQELPWLLEQAEQIGYPVLIKPVAGGGGKGMRVVADAANFPASLAACQREAHSSFGEARVLLEKYLPAPRHIEVQVFGDAAGHIVHLFERDCSAQRRHQKVIEEAPAPRLTETQRDALTGAACEAARAVGYTGAGTVEFLLDVQGRHYFIEMNTRIQVEHAVTEMICDVDLVEWQLRVAAGEPLPLAQGEIRASGHAIEVRLYAEQPEAGFLPASGRLARFELPAAGARSGCTLRLESGVVAGDDIGIDYDPMLAKIIVQAPTRPAALAGLATALAQVRIAGVGNNLLLLRRLLASEAFTQGRIDTDWIERDLTALTGAGGTVAGSSAPLALPPPVLVAAALFQLERERQALAGALAASDPWSHADGWRLNGTLARTLHFACAAKESAGGQRSCGVLLQYRAPGVWIGEPSGLQLAQLLALGHDEYTLQLGERTERLQLLEDGCWLQVTLGLSQYRLRWQDPRTVQPLAPSSEASLAAPMPGRIIALTVEVGARVARGSALLVMEAMKMEHTLCAPAHGAVRAYRARVGDQVQEGTVLVDFEAATQPAR
ncbi:MAG TPA: biotin carboxylase N-terminal domain-containing protein [Steroidobacteraceae bacterium]|nr:biotin carboxylase N-terminal domain-containing protein [Steroidobacteraceae bacterium]